jgi:hypothetical protein
MAAAGSAPRRLDDLLIEPRETLEIELKGWLDIVGGNDHRATLAKALIALANHGGGYVLLGLEEAAGGAVEAAGRPASLEGYTPDTVNAVVARYAEPAFHCDVTIGVAPDGGRYPIVAVPGGHTAPIRAKRDGPSRQVLQNSYYIRRPGPQSDTPASGQEWDQLLRRCLINARDELLDQMRAIMSGSPAVQAAPDAEQQLLQWIVQSEARWQELVSGLAEDSGSRMPLGRWSVGYQLKGDLDSVTLGELRDRMARGAVPHTGWPEFWVPTREGISPYIRDGALECWLGRDAGGPAHADFWRASTHGQFFLVRGYQEDEARDQGFEPGKAFDITLPAWRFGEALLHAENMARLLGDPSCEVIMQVEWTGLAGRAVVSMSGQRAMFGDHKAHQDRFRTSLSVRADEISNLLPELVGQVIRPLYELFDFLRVPDNLAAIELSKMRAHRF